MNRRLLPLALVMAPALFAYACSSSSSKTEEPTPPPPPSEGGTVDNFVPPTDAQPPMDANKPDMFVPPNANPLDGIAAPKEIAALTGIYTEGPSWHGTSLFFSQYATNGAVVKLTLPNTTEIVRQLTGGTAPLGTTFDEKNNRYLTCEVNDGAAGATIMVTPAAGGAAMPLNLMVADAGGLPAFDSPNDIVARKSDGTIYMTDPGYQNPGTATNHLWRIKIGAVDKLAGDVTETVVEGRPNGIALSPDEKTLYVSFTSPVTGPPVIMKYPIATDGAIGAGTKFADVTPADSAADGLAVDTSGNVYVAVKNGVDVFKPDGATKWGHIPTTKIINGISFGGTANKTLFMTSDTGMLTVDVKIAGLLQ